MDTKQYAVIIEWDGQAPPQKWYNRMYEITGGLNARKQSKDPLVQAANTEVNERQLKLSQGLLSELGADYDANLLENRGNHTGIIVQEGCIICMSYSLARTIYHYARRGIPQEISKSDERGEAGETVMIKPAHVWMGEINIDFDVELTKADEAAIKRIDTVLSRRGRRPTPSVFSITCMEEMRTFETEAVAGLRCPSCSGQQIRVHHGATVGYQDPGGDVFSAWQRTRFGATGEWQYVEGTCDAPETVTIKNNVESTMVQRLGESELLTQIQGFDRDDQMIILDAIFISRLYWTEGRRLKTRMEALQKYLVQGGDVSRVELSEGETPDMLDASGPLGSEAATAFLFKAQRIEDLMASDVIA